MRAPHFLLPLVIGLSSLGTGAGGVVAAAELRADERRERAVAAERRAEQREREAGAVYQQALALVAVSVYDLVQPLQQAHADLREGDVSAVNVLIDVSNHLAGPQGLQLLSARLRAIAPATSVQDQHRLLQAALQDFSAAAGMIAALRESDSPTVDADIVARGDLALDAATRDWTRSLTPVFLGASAPPAPVEAGVAGPRPPLSPASYLREAGTLCSTGIDVLDKTGANKRDPSIEQIRAGLRELGARVPKLAMVRAVPAEEERVASSIRGPLQGTLELVTGFDTALAAARRGDATAARRAQAQIARGEAAVQRAAAGFRAYGSQVCALYLTGVENDTSAGTSDTKRTA